MKTQKSTSIKKAVATRLGKTNPKQFFGLNKLDIGDTKKTTKKKTSYRQKSAK